MTEPNHQQNIRDFNKEVFKRTHGLSDKELNHVVGDTALEKEIIFILCDDLRFAERVRELKDLVLRVRGEGISEWERLNRRFEK